MLEAASRAGGAGVPGVGARCELSWSMVIVPRAREAGRWLQGVSGVALSVPPGLAGLANC